MIDNLGRNIDSGQMNPQEMRGLVSSLAKKDVGPAKPYGGDKKDESLINKLLSELGKVIPDISSSTKRMDELSKSVKRLMDTMKRGKTESTTIKDFVASGSKPAKKDKGTKKAEDKMTKLAEHGLKKGSIYTHDQAMVKEMKLLRLQMTGGAAGDIAALAKSLDDFYGKTDKEVSDKAQKATEDEASYFRQENIRQTKYRFRQAVESTKQIQEQVLGYKALEVVLGNLVKAEREFNQDVRSVAFETAGVTKESRGLQKAYEDIGKSSAITGFDRGASQKQYLINLRKGVKDQKLASTIAKTQLNTEKMIGLEAGALGDTFSEMHLQMGMTSMQMADFGRGIQQVARGTGLTGQNLADAVKSSESIMKNMRNAGTLTAESSRNIVGIMANAKKLGVEDKVSEMTGALSKGMTGILSSSKEMQQLIFVSLRGNAEAMQKARNGTLLQTKEGVKALASGMEDALAAITQGRVRSAEDIAKLSEEELGRFNIVAQNTFGMGVAEVTKSIEAYKEQSLSLEDKLQKINDQKKKNLTLEEKATLMEQERSLKTDTALSALTKLDEAAKGVGKGAAGMQEAFSKLDLSSMSNDLKALGIDATDAKSAIKGSVQASVKGVNEALKKAGKKELKIGTKDIEKAMNDPEAFRDLTSKISKAQQEAGVAQKSQVDVLSEVNQSLIQLNDTLRGVSGGVISNLLNSIFGTSFAYLTTLIGVVGDLTSGVVSFAANIYEAQEGFKQLIGAMFPKEQAEKIFKDFRKKFESLGKTFNTYFGSTATSMSQWAVAAAGTAAVILAVSGAFYGAASAGANAAEIFEKSQEELTMAEFYAAKGAGAVTGALNFLTFGVFDSLLGSTGSVTKALAQFNKMIPILSAVVAVVDIVLGAIWGLVLSVKDVFVGAFNMIYYVLEPFGTLLQGIGDAIWIILGPLFSFTTGMEKTGSLFTMFADIFNVFGKVIRFALETIGKLIGGILGIVVGILVPVLKTVATVISVVTNAIGYVFNTVAEGVTGIIQFFQGLFTLDFEKMGRGLWNVFSTLLLGIPNFILRIIAGIPSYITEGIVSIGSSIVNGIVSAFQSLGSWIISWFSGLPSNIYSALYSAASAVGLGWLVKSIGGVPKDKVSEEGFNAMQKMAEEGTKKGSLYTHDIYLERQLMAMNALMAANATTGAVSGVASGAASLVGGVGDFFGSLTSKYEKFKEGFFDSSFFKGMSERFAGFSSSIFGKKLGEGEFGPAAPSLLDKAKDKASEGLEYLKESSLAKSAESFFSPFSKGFERAQEKGEGFFSSLTKGFKSQYMSLTKGGLLKEGGFLDGQKKKLGEMYQGTKDKLFGKKLGEGEFGPAAPGLIDKIKGKAGGLYQGAKDKTGGLYQGAKDRLFGKKLGEGEYGPAAPGLIDRAKGKAGGIYQGAKEKGKSWLEAGKEKLGFGKKEAEGIESVGKAGGKVGLMENAKQGFKNLAEGLKAMSGRDVLFGALNLIPASVGLVAMIPGTAGAYLVSKINGEKLYEGLSGLATGLKAMASAKVLLGALVLIPAAIGLLALVPALPGLAILGFMGPMVQIGLNALGQGMTAFGQAAANPMFWLGLLALAAFNVALIPLAFALSLLAPLVESFGKAVKMAFEGIATVVDSLLGGLTEFVSVLSIEKAAGIIAVAGALGILSVAMVTFGASVATGGLLSFFGGNGILKKISMLAFIGNDLMTAANAMNILSSATTNFNKSLDQLSGAKVEEFAKLFSSSGPLSTIDIPKMTATAEAMGKINAANNPVAQTASNVDLNEKMQREMATSEPTVAKMENSDLGSIAESEKTQVQKLTEVVALLTQMVNNMENNVSGEGGQASGDTETNYVASSPPRYYKWSTGKHNQTAGKGITNLGNVG